MCLLLTLIFTVLRKLWFLVELELHINLREYRNISPSLSTAIFNVIRMAHLRGERMRVKEEESKKNHYTEAGQCSLLHSQCVWFCVPQPGAVSDLQ